MLNLPKFQLLDSLVIHLSITISFVDSLSIFTKI